MNVFKRNAVRRITALFLVLVMVIEGVDVTAIASAAAEFAGAGSAAEYVFEDENAVSDEIQPASSDENDPSGIEIVSEPAGASGEEAEPESQVVIEPVSTENTETEAETEAYREEEASEETLPAETEETEGSEESENAEEETVEETASEEISPAETEEAGAEAETDTAETTVSESTEEETTAAETTPAETIVPETTVPETTAAAVPAAKADEQELLEQTLSVKASDGAVITVCGLLPAGSRVKAEVLKLTGKEIEDAEGNNHLIILAYDVKIITSDGEEYELTEDVNVSIQSPEIRRLDLSEAGILHFDNKEDLQSEIKRTEENAKAKEKDAEAETAPAEDNVFEELAFEEEASDLVSFTTDSFSPILVTLTNPLKMGTALMSSGLGSVTAPTVVGDYYKLNKTFDVDVPISWIDDGTTYRPGSFKVTVYADRYDGYNEPYEPAEEAAVAVYETTVAYEKTSDYFTLTGIPGYVLKGTGAYADPYTLPSSYPDDPAFKATKYFTPGNFYTVKITDPDPIKGYTTVEGKEKSKVTITIDINDVRWESEATEIGYRLAELKNVGFNINWVDNNNAKGVRPVFAADELTEKCHLYYDDGTGTLKPVTGDMLLSGSIECTAENNGTFWTVKYKELPAQYSYYIRTDLTDENYNAEGFEQKATEGSSDLSDVLKEGESSYYVYRDTFDAQIEWCDGLDQLEVTPDDEKPRPEHTADEASGVRPHIILHKVVGTEDEVVASSDYDVVWTFDDSTGIWEFDIPNLDQYTHDGAAISYYVTFAPDDAVFNIFNGQNGSKYHVSYENTESSDNSRVFENGSVKLTLFDDTTVTGTKKWMDDYTETSADPEKRNQAIQDGITIYLWRYPVKDKDGQDLTADTNGAPVIYEGNQLSYRLTASDNTDTILLTADKFAPYSGYLFDKYDEQGFLYKYYFTEIMDGTGYAKSYRDSSLNKTTYGAPSEGTITNTKAEPTRVRAVKEWEDTSYSTDFTSSEVTLELQILTLSGWEPAKDMEGNDVPDISMANFTEDTRSKSKFFGYSNKYDENGKLGTFRVVEKTVTYGGTPISIGEFHENPEGSGKFVSGEYEMNGLKYVAVSEQTADGVWTVKNIMSGSLEYDIEKIWEGGEDKWKDGEGNWYIDDITLHVDRYINGELDQGSYLTVKTNEVTPDSPAGTAVVIKTSEKAVEEGFTAPENCRLTDVSTSLDWLYPTLKLKGFSDAGEMYTYEVREEKAALSVSYGVWTEYFMDTTDNIEMRAKVHNYIGEGGDWITINAEKRWIDDYDVHQRKTVYAQVVKINEDGSIDKNVFRPAQTNPYITGTEPYIIELSEHKFWKGQISIWGPDFTNANGECQWGLIEYIGKKTDGNYERDMAIDSGYSSTAEVVTGTVDAIHSEDGKNYPGYKVKIESRDNTHPTSGENLLVGSRDYLITNKRVGVQTYTVNKKWMDGRNGGNTRGTYFKVDLFKVDPVTKAVDTTPAGTLITEWKEDEASRQRDYKYVFGAAVADATYSIDTINLYDDQGRVINYEVKEYITFAEGPAESIAAADWILVDDMISKENTATGYVSVTQDDDPVIEVPEGTHTLRRRLGTNCQNKLEGTVRNGVRFYKLWHDEDNAKTRPDIRYDLYVQKSDGSAAGTSAITKYSLDLDNHWENAAEAGNDFYQFVEYKNMSAGDAEGEYGHYYSYFAGETLNNENIPYYQEYYVNGAITLGDGTGVYKTSEKIGTTDTYHYDIASGNTPVSDTLKSGTKQLIPEEGVIVNSIRGRILLNGKKIWKSGTKAIADTSDLPDAEISFYRTSVHDKKHDHEVIGTDPVVIAELPHGNSSYTVTEHESEQGIKDDSYYHTGEYARFDKYGARFTYQPGEVMFLENTDHDIYVPGYVYNFNGADITELTNTYNETANYRSIRTDKEFANLTAEGYTDHNPVARFSLWRLEVPQDYCVSHTVTVNGKEYVDPRIDFDALNLLHSDIFTLNGKNLSTTAGWEKVSTKSVTYKSAVSYAEWTKQHIYAETGRPFIYAVVEEDNGRESFVVSNEESTEITSDPVKNLQLAGNIVVLGINLPVSEIETFFNVDGTLQNEQSTTIKNNYQGGQIDRLTGSKQFVGTPSGTMVYSYLPDQGAASGTDITAEANANITLAVSRKSANQDGSGNGYTEEVIDPSKYEVHWTQGSVSGAVTTWKYTVEFTEAMLQYAPNGRPYIYCVEEVMKDGSIVKRNYVIKNGSAFESAEKAVDTDGKKVLNIQTALENDLKGDLTVQKHWIDYYDEYRMRSMSIMVALQYKLDHDTEWETFDTRELNSYNSWKTTFSYLPAAAFAPESSGGDLDTGSKYKSDILYRVIEVQIKDGLYVWNMSSEDQKQSSVPVKVGNYWITHATQTEEPSETGDENLTVPGTVFEAGETHKITGLKVTNHLASETKLQVTKKWNDNNDIYKLRDTSLTLQLQEKLADGAPVATAECGWKNSKDASGENVRVTISGSDADPSDTTGSTWKHTFEHLPAKKWVENITTHKMEPIRKEYRVVEEYNGNIIEPSESGNQAGAYLSKNDSVVDVLDKKQTITNEIIIKEKLSVEKIWNDDKTEHGTAVIELRTDDLSGTKGQRIAVVNLGASSNLIDKNALPVTIYTTKLTYSFGDALEGSIAFDIPKYNASGTEVNYYAVETSPTAADYYIQYFVKDLNKVTSVGTYTETTDDKKAPAGAAKDDSDDEHEYTLIAANTLRKSAEFTKTWADDSNYFKIRSGRVTAELQRRTSTSGTWETVTGYDAVTVNGSGNSWVKTITDLPAYELCELTSDESRIKSVPSHEKMPYEYGFVEKEIGSNELDSRKASGYQASVEVTSNDKTGVTNTVIPKERLAVEKLWNDDAAEHAPAQFELYAANLHNAPEKIAVVNLGASAKSLTKGAAYPAMINTTELTYAFGDSAEEAIAFDVPKYNASGAEVSYYIIETSPTSADYHIQYFVQDRNKTAAAVEYSETTSAGKAEAGAAKDTSSNEHEYTLIAANTPLVKAGFTKNWVDNTNLFNQRPGKITVQLQRTEDNGATWADARKVDGTKYTSAELFEDKFTNTWTKEEDTGLPQFELASVKSDGSLIKYHKQSGAEDKTLRYDYRYRETKLGDKNVVYETDGVTGKGGSYNVSSVTVNTTGSKYETTVTNTLPVVSRKFVKNWTGDADYRTSYTDWVRPGSIRVKIEASTDGTIWSEVKRYSASKTSGETYLVTAAPDDWNGKFEQLPEYFNITAGESGKYMYRVVEYDGADNFIKAYEISNPASDTSVSQTITNDLKLTEITVLKNWFDAENLFLTRPTSVTVKLQWKADSGWNDVKKADGTLYTKELNEGNGWKVTYDNLPEYYEYDTKKFSYRVVETPVPGNYTVTDDNNSGTKKVDNTLKASEIPFEKKWSDYENKYNTRPASIWVKLQKKSTGDWEDVLTKDSTKIIKELSAAENWRVSISDLPQVDSAENAYSYRLLEIVSSTDETPIIEFGTYSVGYGADGKTLTNTLKETSIEVTKVWEDQSDIYMLRPESVVFKLQRKSTGVWEDVKDKDNNLITKTLLGGGDTWTEKFEHLPAKDNSGNDFTYRIVELNGSGDEIADNGSLEEYKVTYSVDHLTVTNTLEVTELTPVKKWSDYSNKYGIRPVVEVKLQWSKDNGTSWEEIPFDTTETITEGYDSNEWTGDKYEKLPKYYDRASGAEYKYRIVELNVNSDNRIGAYDVTYSADGTTVTNKLDETEVSFKKVWSDDSNSYGLRKPVKVKLQWITNEDTDAWYFVPETDEMIIDVSEGDVVKTFEHLPKYYDGTHEYKYRVVELDSNDIVITDGDEIAGYKVTYSYTGEPQVITNTIVTTDVSLVKKWTDDSDRYGLRPSEITVKLQHSIDNGVSWENVKYNGSDVTSSVHTGSGSDWIFAFTKLPVKDADGKEYIYRIVELDSSNAVIESGNAAYGSYTAEYKADASGKWYIENTLQTKDVTLTKTWADQENKYSLRPSSVWVMLESRIEGGSWTAVQYESADVTAELSGSASTWSKTFTGLPKYNAEGKEFDYRIVEIKSDTDHTAYNEGDQFGAYTVGYGTDEKTLTNTLDETSFEIIKRWDDQSNRYEVRPASIKVVLEWKHGTGEWEPVVPAAVKDDLTGTGVNWTYKFENLPAKDAEGNAYFYRVAEYNGDTRIEENGTLRGYTVNYAADNRTIMNTLPTVDVNYKKVWDDQTNKYGIRPAVINVKLQWRKTDSDAWTDVPGTTAREVTGAADSNEWTEVSYTELPRYYDGTNEYQYRIVEFDGTTVLEAGDKLKGYTVSYSTDTYGTRVVTNKLDTVDITLSKKWSDQTDKYGLRPGSVSVMLQHSIDDTNWYPVKRNGADVIETISRPAGTTVNEWTIGFTDLPEKDADGNAYYYRIAELNGSDVIESGEYLYGYEVTYEEEDGKWFIRNSMATVSARFDKKWDDFTDRYELRPDTVTLKLQWSHDQKAYTDSTKTWSDVIKDGSKVEATISQAEGWMVKFTDLPKYYDVFAGIEYDYRVLEMNGDDEVEADGEIGAYIVTYTYEGGQKKVINTLKKAAEITLSKIWADHQNRYGLRPDKVYVRLESKYEGASGWTPVKADGAVVAREITGDTTDATWSTVFTDLPAKNKDGKEFTYRIVETNADGSVVYGEGDANVLYTVSYGTDEVTLKNTIIERTDVTVEKIWNDGESAHDEIRAALYSTNYEHGDATSEEPSKLTFEGAEVTLNGGNSWRHTWDTLPALNKDGKTIVYSVKEVNTPSDYSVRYATKVGDGSYADSEDRSGDTAETDKKVDVKIINSKFVLPTAQKIWDDEDDKFNERPELTLTLRRKLEGTDDSTYEDVEDGTGTVIAVTLAKDKTPEEWQAATLAAVTGKELPNWKTISVADDGTVSYEFYEYRWFEKDVPAGYELVSDTVTPDRYKGDSSEITNKLRLQPVTLTKKWDDNHNDYQLRNESILVKVKKSTDNVNFTDVLYDGEPVVIEINGDMTADKWEAAFRTLPVCDEHGDAYIYRMVEVEKTGTEYTEVSTIGSYDVTNVEEDGNWILTNTLSEEGKGVLIINKKIDKLSADEVIPDTEFPMDVEITIGDGTVRKYEGTYYLYDDTYNDAEIRADARLAVSTLGRTEKTAVGGIVLVAAGKKAVLTDIRKEFSYSVTESPAEFGYIVGKIENGTETVETGHSAENTEIRVVENFATKGAAKGLVRMNDLVVIHNQRPVNDLRIDNITPEERKTKYSTGGQVRVFLSADGKEEESEYKPLTTDPYLEWALRVEWEPDVRHFYTYDDWIRINWWNYGEDLNGEPHSVVVKNYTKRVKGKYVPITGSYYRGKPGQDCEEGFEEIWGEIAQYYEYIRVTEGSVVMTMAPDAVMMPRRTLIEVLFKRSYDPDPEPDPDPTPKPTPTPAPKPTEPTTPETMEIGLLGENGEDLDPFRLGLLNMTGDRTPLGILAGALVLFMSAFAAVDYTDRKKRKKH